MVTAKHRDNDLCLPASVSVPESQVSRASYSEHKMTEFLQYTTKNRPDFTSSEQRIQMKDLKKYTCNPELEEEIVDAVVGDGNIPDFPARLIPCQLHE